MLLMLLQPAPCQMPSWRRLQVTPTGGSRRPPGRRPNGLGDGMKELIALKLVPLFSSLTLEQLSSIDRLMVTRHYAKGESIFIKGDVGTELLSFSTGRFGSMSTTKAVR